MEVFQPLPRLNEAVSLKLMPFWGSIYAVVRFFVIKTTVAMLYDF